MQLATDGDPYERRYWHAFASKRFPAYEEFWLTEVVPLTRRDVDPRDVRFKSRAEIPDQDEAVTRAQLHYTVLRHLGCVWEILSTEVPEDEHPTREVQVIPGPGSAVIAVPPESHTSGGSANAHNLSAAHTVAIAVPDGHRHSPLDYDAYTEAFVRLSAASDVADELLERHVHPGEYMPPWDEGTGKTARWKWRKRAAADPLAPIRSYRNRLVHGRILPGAHHRRVWHYPRIEHADRHLDWRASEDPVALRDFAPARQIAQEAWEATIDYVEANWRRSLLQSQRT